MRYFARNLHFGVSRRFWLQSDELDEDGPQVLYYQPLSQGTAYQIEAIRAFKSAGSASKSPDLSCPSFASQSQIVKPKDSTPESMDMIAQVPPIVVHGKTAACDGGTRSLFLEHFSLPLAQFLAA